MIFEEIYRENAKFDQISFHQIALWLPESKQAPIKTEGWCGVRALEVSWVQQPTKPSQL